MKNTTLSIISVLGLCNLVSAQNVGINTDGSAPTMMLHVKVASGNDGIRIQNNSGTGDGIINFQDGGADAWTLGFDANDNNDFKISNGGALGANDRFILDDNTNQILSGFAGSQANPAWSFSADVNTGMYNSVADELAFSAAGVELLVLDANGADQVVVNENSTDVNFRVESNNQANLLYTDGGTDRIGFRTAAPGFLFEMSNNGTAIGATAMGQFTNASNTGVALSIDNSNAAIGFNTFESYGVGTGAALSALHFSFANNRVALDAGTNAANDRWGIGTTDNVIALNYFVISDGRLKEGTKRIESSTSKIMGLNPVSYRFNDEAHNGLGISQEPLHYGFLAAEVQSVLPDLVAENSFGANTDGNGNLTKYRDHSEDNLQYSAVNYQEIIPILVGAIQEQQALIESLQEKIESLETK